MELFLHVAITVAQGRLEEFYRAKRAFLKTKVLETAPINWRFVGGFRVISENFPDTGSDRRVRIVRQRDDSVPEVSFINFWQLPSHSSTTDIPKIMVRISEISEYIKLDLAVLDEIQNVVYQVNKQPEVDDQATILEKVKQTKRAALIRHYPFRSMLGQFAFNFGALAPKWAKQNNYSFGGTYQAITGLLNEFWSVCVIDEYTTGAQVREALGSFIRSQAMAGERLGRSIDFDNDGPDDGVVVVEPAEYWLNP
jgi:hypothetical protein